MSELDVHVKYITESIQTLAKANDLLDKRLREHMEEEIQTTNLLHTNIGKIEAQVQNAKFYVAGVASVMTVILAVVQVFVG